MAGILPELPDLHYLIVGKGPDEPRLRALTAELGIGAAVTFVGYVPDDQLPDFYNLCDLFVMPNRQEEEDGDIEGFGMIFMEASAAGKAVVGGRSGGTADAVQHGVTGFLVNPQDVDELTATLKLLLASVDLRQKLGLAGSRRARAEFGWQSRARMLREISEAIVEKSRQPRAAISRRCTLSGSTFGVRSGPDIPNRRLLRRSHRRSCGTSCGAS